MIEIYKWKICTDAWIFFFLSVYFHRKWGMKFIFLYSDIYKKNIGGLHPNNDNINIFRCYIDVRKLMHFIGSLVKILQINNIL